MFYIFFRCLAFIVGLALLVDIGLPARMERVKVDQHTSDTRSTNEESDSGDTGYTFHLIGGQVETCSVGYQAFKRVKDGDTVELRSSKLFKNCIELKHREDVILKDRYWKIYWFIAACVLLAISFGFFRMSDDRDGSTIDFDF